MKIIRRDPVCGMEADESSPFRVLHEGVTYLFCSGKCREKFERNPDQYMGSETQEQPMAHWTARNDSVKIRQPGRGGRWQDYVQNTGGWNWMTWMHDFMGFFLVVFSMFKLFDLSGFADGFQMYDLLAKPFRPYAFVYPFIELSLGLGYLSHWQSRAIYLATMVVMLFGALGVFNALRKKLDLECACMGTILKVPLSTVALIEDLGMAAMAAAMLLMHR
jgi:YHS domain-containing protein